MTLLHLCTLPLPLSFQHIYLIMHDCSKVMQQFQYNCLIWPGRRNLCY